MTNSTNFVSGTKITKEWLNDVDSAVFDGTTVHTPTGPDAVVTTVGERLNRFINAYDWFTPNEKANFSANLGTMDIAPAIQRCIDAQGILLSSLGYGFALN